MHHYWKQEIVIQNKQQKITRDQPTPDKSPMVFGHCKGGLNPGLEIPIWCTWYEQTTYSVPTEFCRQEKITQGGRGNPKTACSSVVVPVVVAQFGLTGHSWSLQAHLKGETHFEPLDAGPSKCGATGQSNFPTKSDVQFPCRWVGHPILWVPDRSVSSHTEQPGLFHYFVKV